MKTDKKTLESIKKILEKNKLLTLSTFDKNIPHSNTAFYTFDNKFNLYIWSEEGTAHGKNMLKNKKVAVNIFDSSQKWGSLLQGIQVRGVAKQIRNIGMVKVGLLYLKRFPAAIKIVKNPARFHDKIFESKLYKIELREIKVFDEKNFGKGGFREVYL